VCSSDLGQVLSILNASTKTTQWITIPTQITNYVNYDNTAKTIISNVSGTPTTITDLVISSSIGSSTAQKFKLPTSAPSFIGSSLQVSSLSPLETQWSIPQAIDPFVSYDATAQQLENNTSFGTSYITDLIVSSSLGSSIAQKFVLPSNSSTSTVGQVLSILNASTKTTQWITIPTQISNYVNFDNVSKTIISNVSGTPTTITDLVISSSLGSSTTQKFVLPNNSSTSTVGQVLSILNASTKTTQWITIPTQISNYVNYSSPNLISNISGTPTTISNLTIGPLTCGTINSGAINTGSAQITTTSGVNCNYTDISGIMYSKGIVVRNASNEDTMTVSTNGALSCTTITSNNNK
jgi:hypothetical protein